MNKTDTENRMNVLYENFNKHLNQFFNEAKLNSHDYTKFVNWFDRLGREGDIPLFMDLLVSSQVINPHVQMNSSLLGPFYVEGSPVLAAPYKLPMREKEKGKPLIFSGVVKDRDGHRLPKTLVDIWQTDHDGCFSSFNSEAPPYNLRGRFYTDENGEFKVETIVPGAYTIPSDGPIGEFFKLTDLPFQLPSHLNVMFKRKGYETLVTQIVLEDDDLLSQNFTTKMKDHGTHRAASFQFVMSRKPT